MLPKKVYQTLVKGYVSEYIVFGALLKLQKGEYIDTFKKVERKSADDYRGIDYWVQYKGISVPLQVKSSEYYAQLHRERYPDIPCVVAGKGLEQSIKQLVREYVWQKQNESD